MPKEVSSRVLKRQWAILQFLLLQNQYVSTSDIEEHLYHQEMETPLRTIQRDLNLLEQLFPLECKRDSIPYNWRWKRIKSTIKGLNLTQALILTLVNEELNDIFPEHIKEELEPLFLKARLLASNAIAERQDRDFQDILSKRSSNPQNLGFKKPSVMEELGAELSHRVTKFYRETFNVDAKELRPLLEQASVILESHELPEFARLLRNFD